MTPLTPTDILPLEIDADGVARVGNTRVTLDTIIMAFTDGAAAEEIAQRYPYRSANTMKPASIPLESATGCTTGNRDKMPGGPAPTLLETTPDPPKAVAHTLGA